MRNATKNTARMIVATIAAIAVNATAALHVDFGQTGAPASETEIGFDAFAVDNNYTSPIFTDFSGTGIDNGSDIRITLTDNATDPAARRMVDRGTTGWTGGSDALLRDWVGIDNRPGTTGSADTLTLTIDNLATGRYRIRSYHTDISTGGNQSAPMDISIDGALWIDGFQGKSQVTAPTTTVPNFFDVFQSNDGSSSLTIDYQVTSTGGNSAFTVLNGLEIIPITQYAIDIDSTRLGGTNTGGTRSTQPGWTSLDATTHSEPGSPAGVVIDGINFELFSLPNDQSRIRELAGPTPNPNALTADFVFEEGSNDAAVGLRFGGAGDLAAGEWEVELWSWDQNVGNFGEMIVGLRDDNAETIITTSALPDPDDPIVTFRFISDGVSAYDVFVRENNGTQRTRLNAVRLTMIPAPAALPAGLAMIGLIAARRRRK